MALIELLAGKAFWRKESIFCFQFTYDRIVSLSS